MKKNKQQNNEVEPISENWYKRMAIFTTIQGIPVIIVVTILSLIGLTGIFMGELLAFILALIGLALVTALFLYIVHLFAASRGKEAKFWRGKRFLLGYITGIFLLAVWMAVAMFIQISFVAPPSLMFIINNRWEVYVAILSGLVLGMPILIFNIIDHLRYRKYLREQRNKQ